LKFFADLHIHSKYSRATSKSLCLEELAIWAQKKGLGLLSVGDFTHPAWFQEIQEKLIPEENGAYRLRPDIEKAIGLNPLSPVRFILSVEISTIYKKGDKTRKVHHCVFMPDIASASVFRQKLGAMGNINSDGRPILGLDSRSLLETVLDSSEDGYIIPAHIWTPWFSVLGSKSGFDSIEECYEDLSPHIFAVETGLSSDPAMNWQVSSLDKYTLVSNSDAHSASKLAREATIFDCSPDYFSVKNALKTGNGYVGTVEFFPEEGKYHEDGHRKCNVCLTPAETKELNGICPVCNKPLTIGVSYRVSELADKKEGCPPPPKAGKVLSLVPLAEILSEIAGVGVQSKSVVLEYERLIQKFGSELSILNNIPTDEFSNIKGGLLSEAISRLREGKVIKQAGYDGEYGIIRLFEDSELKKDCKNLKLKLDIPVSQEKSAENKILISVPKTENKPLSTTLKSFEAPKDTAPQKNYGLDEYQNSAVVDEAKKLLIVAGPGSGKTTVLTRRIAHLIKNGLVCPENCLAITFTKRAAQEMKERLEKLLPESFSLISIHTFHSLCYSILKENATLCGLNPDFKVITETEKALYEGAGEDFDPKMMIDFDSLITKCVELFKENPDKKEFYRDKFKYLSVDEYQDIDENQYHLIKYLSGDDGAVCAIGDPNQAIYGFRGGNSKFFNTFKEDFANAKVINLKNNYRSTNAIVDASNQMINCFNIISQYGKPCEKITIHTAPTDKAEAEFVVSTIENMIGGNSFFSIDSERSEGINNDLSFGDFAILYRTKSQLEPLIEAIARSGMPYVKLSNDMLFDIKPVKNLLLKLKDDTPVLGQLEDLKSAFFEDTESLQLEYIFDFLLKTASNFPKKSDFIHEISLTSEADTLDKRADRITLMTLHASKGLEYKCVFIVGNEDGIIPLYRAKEEDEIEEEKRLLYVGMTRAKERLFLTRAHKRKWLGTYRNLPSSPFLDKIQSDLFNLSRFDKQFKKDLDSNSTQLKLF